MVNNGGGYSERTIQVTLAEKRRLTLAESLEKVP